MYRCGLLLSAVLLVPLLTFAVQSSKTAEVPSELKPLPPRQTFYRGSALVQPIELAEWDRPDAPLAHAHPHGDVICASGCALSRHPTRRLSQDQFEQLIAGLQVASRRDAAIDELLYFGPQAARQLRSSRSVVAEANRKLLQNELKLSRVRIQMRLVAEDESVLAELPQQIVPLDVRHEYRLVARGLPALEVSGTVKRVGRYDLWTRF